MLPDKWKYSLILFLDAEVSCNFHFLSVPQQNFTKTKLKQTSVSTDSFYTWNSILRTQLLTRLIIVSDFIVDNHQPNHIWKHSISTLLECTSGVFQHAKWTTYHYDILEPAVYKMGMYSSFSIMLTEHRNVIYTRITTKHLRSTLAGRSSI